MRLGRLEILGAWLGVWTPPRGAEVPPVPWRAVAAGAAVLVVGVGVAAAVLVPQVSGDRQERGERERRIAAERHAEQLATAGREQRPRTGRGTPDPLGAPAERRVETRSALLASAQAAIGADAGRRTDRDIRGVDCEAFPRTLRRVVPVEQLRRPAGAYQCVAVTARFDQGDERRDGIIGIPFRLVVRFTEGRYAWCRVVPLSDRDRLTHPLPAACRV